MNGGRNICLSYEIMMVRRQRMKRQCNHINCRLNCSNRLADVKEVRERDVKLTHAQTSG